MAVTPDHDFTLLESLEACMALAVVGVHAHRGFICSFHRPALDHGRHGRHPARGDRLLFKLSHSGTSKTGPSPLS